MRAPGRGEVSSLAPRDSYAPRKERLAMEEWKGARAAVFFCNLARHHGAVGQPQGLESQGKGTVGPGGRRSWQRAGSPVKLILQPPPSRHPSLLWPPMSPSSVCPRVHVFFTHTHTLGSRTRPCPSRPLSRRHVRWTPC